MVMPTNQQSYFHHRISKEIERVRLSQCETSAIWGLLVPKHYLGTQSHQTAILVGVFGASVPAILNQLVRF